MTRAEIHRRFVSRFCPEQPAKQIRENDLIHTEAHLGVLFPDAYRRFIVSYGPVATPSILETMVDAKPGGWDVSWFFAPAECVETTESYRHAGMSDRLVAFASDCMGNVFCFEESTLLDARRDDAPVWLFDHDYCKDSRLADSFDEWLTIYLNLP